MTDTTAGTLEAKGPGPGNAYDAMRRRCVAHDEIHRLLRLQNMNITARTRPPEICSTSSPPAIAVPNGMDAPNTPRFRAVSDKSTSRLEKFAPVIRDRGGIIAELPRVRKVGDHAGLRSGIRNACTERLHRLATCLEQPLAEWIEKNRVATLRRDRENR